MSLFNVQSWVRLRWSRFGERLAHATSVRYLYPGLLSDHWNCRAISASDSCRSSVEDASLSLPLLVVKTTSDSWIHDFVDVPSGYGFRCFVWTTHFHPIGDFRQHVDNRVRASLLSWSSKTLPLGADRIGKPHGHPDMELRYGSLSCRPSVGSFSFVHAFRPRH